MTREDLQFEKNSLENAFEHLIQKFRATDSRNCRNEVVPSTLVAVESETSGSGSGSRCQNGRIPVGLLPDACKRLFRKTMRDIIYRV